MNTKDKILSCALRMFNEKGLENVPTRSICSEMKISPGNLTYHFKKKEEIVFALYLQLVDEISNNLESHLSQRVSVESMFSSFRQLYSSQLKYRFCMIDFVQIMRTQPKIRQHFNQLVEIRKQQFSMFFQKAIESKIIVHEEFPGLYQLLGLNMSISGDYWLSHSEVLFKGSKEEALKLYLSAALVQLYPYLTPESKKEFAALISG